MYRKALLVSALSRKIYYVMFETEKMNIWTVFAEAYLIFLTETSVLITTHVSKMFWKFICGDWSEKHFTRVNIYKPSKLLPKQYHK